MVNRRLFLLVAAFLLLATAAFAQTGNIEGVVLLPNHGGPAAGAAVTLYIGMSHDSLTAVADDSGRFAFDAVAAGRYMLRATLAGYNPAMGDAFVRSGETARVMLVLMPLPTGFGRVEGIVYLPEHGGPAAGATVWLFRARGDSMVTTADDSGRYAFDSARVGLHDLHAALANVGDAHIQVMVMDGRTTFAPLFLRGLPVPMYGNLHGIVIFGADSLPASGATVTVYFGRHDSLTATTGAEGTFAFDSLRTGPYEVRATLEGYLPAVQRAEVRNGQTANVRLVLRPVPTAVVTGTVTLANQTPVAGAIVTLGGPHYRGFARVRTDSTGTFTFNHVAAGHYFVAAFARGNGEAHQQIDVADGQTVTVTLVLSDSIGHRGAPEAPNGTNPVKQLVTNFPNPFNPTTTISYTVPMAGQVRLSVYDVLGRKVADLVNDYRDAGSYNVSFSGENLPSGFYFYRLNTGNLTHTGRMMLLK